MLNLAIWAHSIQIKVKVLHQIALLALLVTLQLSQAALEEISSAIFVVFQPPTLNLSAVRLAIIAPTPKTSFRVL